MTKIKIMLVEDDKSLREIYGVRLFAEGYDIVSAGDGEEALAIAIKERPQLIISDVMMPKISGFDMLDILRSTTETRGIKVIMMTALSSDDQRLRGETLGADRYLVKSQVGIEDVVRVVHEVLGDQAAATAPQPQPSTPVPATLQPTQAMPVAPTAPAPQPQPVQVQPPTVASTAPQAPGRGLTYQSPPLPQQPMAPQAPAAAAPQPHLQQPVQPSAPRVAAPRSNRVIQPLNNPAIAPIDINELLDKELAREAGVDLENRPSVVSVDQERALIDTQIQQFQNAPVPPAPPAPDFSQPTSMPGVMPPSTGGPALQSGEEPPAAPPIQPAAPIR